MIRRLLKAVIRGLVYVLKSVVGTLVFLIALPFITFWIACDALKKLYRKTILWAFFDNDKDAMKKYEWRNT